MTRRAFPLRVAINGFARIGRLVLRAMLEGKELLGIAALAVQVEKENA